MTDTITKPTICTECKHRIPGNEWMNDVCSAKPTPNYVRGGVLGYRKCYIHNDTGNCPDYTAAEQAAQVQADGEGVQG